ncbi:hypothetical protein [Magnetospirillum sp. UT-4]|uniref:hypothetical protein n=1 Tax=Magnetospirillum sp. UT-4 TaxID=2681467 RepID=UPI00137EFF01|nr:hypothetical protein [Magnetospirillum sp. UT-4]CAA7620154.1 conserved exported hypothetical protein [Magnetospirillum sp. UT-4]
MGIGRIASFLSTLSPASDAAQAAASVDSDMPDPQRLAEEAAAQQEHDRQRRQSGAAQDITQQLQTMISAVRTLNENAVQQGAAVAVSQAGTQLKNAVAGLGHLLAVVDAQSLGQSALPQLKQAGEVVDVVEAGLAGTQAAAEQVLRHLPAQQALAAQAATERFQTEMRAALDQVRGALGGMRA